MTRIKRILIAGAGIAGPALAYWLHRYGYETVIVERASALRTGGQNIDVRGAGRTVSRRMGIEAQIRAAGTGELGTRFVDGQGQTRGGIGHQFIWHQPLAPCFYQAINDLGAEFGMGLHGEGAVAIEERGVGAKIV